MSTNDLSQQRQRQVQVDNNKDDDDDDDATSAGPPERQEMSTWTQLLPEAFGIRQTIRQSPYRWCARESAMWGIATGTAMGLHRLRMGSSPYMAGNVAFGTMFVVLMPSYYFCCKRRDYQEQYIELMMRANDIESSDRMPSHRPNDDPFVTDTTNDDDDDTTSVGMTDTEFYGRLQERKEWQTQTPTQDAKQVFTPISSNPSQHGQPPPQPQQHDE